MKIWYSVQTTGLGHLTQYLALARILSDRGHEVITLTSGPTPPSFFKPVGSKYYHLNGPTLLMNNYRMSFSKTILHNLFHSQEFFKNFWTFRKLIQIEKPDLVVIDYEPFASNYLRFSKSSIPSFSVDHQSIFVSHLLPFSGIDFELKLITRLFSYAKTRLCINYIDYGKMGSFICAPTILRDEILNAPVTDDGSILVYHSFSTSSDQERIIQNCSSDRKFIFYGYEYRIHKNLTFKPKGDDFLKDLAKCHVYITNCGVESVCEALVLGKRSICQPIKGQSEQKWNGRILKAFKNVRVVDEIDYRNLNVDYLSSADPKQVEWLRRGKEYALRYILGESFSEPSSFVKGQ